MAGRPSARMVEAMKLVHHYKVTPYQAAKRLQVNATTMYKSRLYALWKENSSSSLAALERELDLDRPVPRVAKKPQRFMLVKDAENKS